VQAGLAGLYIIHVRALVANRERFNPLMFAQATHGRLGSMIGCAIGLFPPFLAQDEAEKAVALPQGKYDLPLIIQDRSFSSKSEFDYPDNVRRVSRPCARDHARYRDTRKELGAATSLAHILVCCLLRCLPAGGPYLCGIAAATVVSVLPGPPRIHGGGCSLLLRPIPSAPFFPI